VNRKQRVRTRLRYCPALDFLGFLAHSTHDAEQVDAAICQTVAFQFQLPPNQGAVECSTESQAQHSAVIEANAVFVKGSAYSSPLCTEQTSRDAGDKQASVAVSALEELDNPRVVEFGFEHAAVAGLSFAQVIKAKT